MPDAVAELADLQPDDQLEAVARMVLGQRLARDLDHKVGVAGIDFEAEKTTFLETAGKTRSRYIKAAYLTSSCSGCKLGIDFQLDTNHG
jgi:hypothetical protein